MVSHVAHAGRHYKPHGRLLSTLKILALLFQNIIKFCYLVGLPRFFVSKKKILFILLGSGVTILYIFSIF